ncbi:MAG: tetratricopeptide repeat protein, partial [Planctomycetes bacterium]|nr:tetratricopeptide repeat protein [Planctomycetota bacterium]
SLPHMLGPQGPTHDGVSLSSKSTPSADLHVAAARMSEGAGQLAEAGTHYQQALAIDSRHADALVGYARLKDSQGFPDQALALYQTAAKAHPGNASVFNALGLTYARQRKFNESITTMEQAVRLEPKKGLYRNNIAMVLVEMGDAEGALAHLKTIQSEAVAHYNVGYILQKKGDSKAAAVHFAKAAEQDPSLSEAGVWLARLQAKPPQAAQPKSRIASPASPRIAEPASRIASDRQTVAPYSAVLGIPAPAAHTGAPASPPPFVKPPPVVPEIRQDHERPKPILERLPPVPQPLTFSLPAHQTGPAPLPPPCLIGRGNHEGQPVSNSRPTVHALPPVEDHSELP